MTKRGPGREIPWMMRVLSWPIIALTKGVQKIEVSGAENIPPTGPAIFVSNHTSHLDPFVTAVSLYEAGVPPRFVAKKEVFVEPLGTILRAAGQIKLDRDQPLGIMEQMAQALDQGKSLIIYPEGTFTQDPAGWPMRGKTGIARLHELRPDIPIIPIATWGNERLVHQWTGRLNLSRILNRTERVLVRFMPPTTLEGDTYQEQANSIMTLLAHEVADLRRELGRPMGEPPAERHVPDMLRHRLRKEKIVARRIARKTRLASMLGFRR